MRSDGRFLLAALLVHAAALGMASRIPAPAPPEDRREAPADPIDVELLRTPDPAPAAALLEPPPAPPPAPDPRASEPPRPGAGDARAVAGAPASGPSPASPVAPAPRDAFDPVPDDRGTAPGIGASGSASWAILGAIQPGTAAPAPTGPPAPRAPDRVWPRRALQEDLRRRDKEIGLDLPAAGTVASVVADAVRASATPATARATFAVYLDGSGRVRDVRVIGMTDGDLAAWQAAARAVAAQLATRALSMPGAYAGGAVVAVEVTSVEQSPDGTKSARARKLLHEPDPPPALGPSDFGLTLTLPFEPSNLGAHKVRVVSTRFSVQPAR